MQSKLLLTLASLLTLVSPASAQSHRSGGAALGGVAGAIAGGIIGHQNDETPEGALIGGAIGAIAGGVLGNAKDHQAARDQHYQYRIWRQQQQLNQQHARRDMGLVTMNDVVRLSRSGVSESVIINHIQNRGVERRPETHDIISLHQQGVSETVITAMQRCPAGRPPAVAAPAFERPAVVVHREYRPAPRAYIPAYPTYRRAHVYHHGPRHYHRY